MACKKCKKTKNCKAGLKGNGALKKGFRFVKGGRIVQAKFKKKAKK